MLRRLIQLAAVTVLTAGLAIFSGPLPAVAKPEPTMVKQWREVFSSDGTITRSLLPTERVTTLSAADAAAIAAAGVVTIQDTGPSSQRFDVVIVGDGYTASQMGTLLQHAQSKWSEIAATTPWSTYNQSINVWLVNVISNQSGVDNDPTQGINRDTALDMYFWCSGIERLLCVNQTKVQQYVAQAPAADAVIALANTTKYGGAGYTGLSTVAGGNAQAGRIAIHELGHSVGGLADEYFTSGTTYNGPEPSQPNVTRSSSGSKWASYLGQATPDGGVIGAYQGGSQYQFGIYRPSQDSLMRTLNKPFNLIGEDAMDQAISAKIGGGGGATCTGFENTRTGSLSSGGSQYQPNGSYFFTGASGQHQACLDGPTGANFNLELRKWSGSSWQTVASATTSSADETLTYNGTSGYYTYRIVSVTGSGSYTLGYNVP